MRLCVLLCLILLAGQSSGQLSVTDSTKKPVEKKWYESLKLGGYAQLRYNRLLESNKDLKCDQCDRAWGPNNSLYFRRLRLVMSGNVHERLFVYMQLELSAGVFMPSSSGTPSRLENWHFTQIRDAYFDYGLDSKNEFRLRFGQAKVPFGFDNLQSSGVRLPMDRSDAINSAAPNERDLGAYFLWSPERIRKLQRDTLTKNGLKGGGDYGVFALGIYNGQSSNRPEMNNQMHVVARVSYPFQFAGQVLEPGVHAYAGRYVLMDYATAKTTSDREYDDQRLGAGFALQPKPFGIQAEYNIGTGPEYDPAVDSVKNQKLEGGYVLLSFRKAIGNQLIQPFARAQYYKGGYKILLDARHLHTNEYEAGIEYTPFKNLEITASYVLCHRRYGDSKVKYYDEKGNLLRLQLQFNY